MSESLGWFLESWVQLSDLNISRWILLLILTLEARGALHFTLGLIVKSGSDWGLSRHRVELAWWHNLRCYLDIVIIRCNFAQKGDRARFQGYPDSRMRVRDASQPILELDGLQDRRLLLLFLLVWVCLRWYQEILWLLIIKGWLASHLHSMKKPKLRGDPLLGLHPWELNGWIPDKWHIWMVSTPASMQEIVPRQLTSNPILSAEISILIF